MNSNILFATLILAVCLTQVAADIYAPSIPAIADAFQTSINQVQWSIVLPVAIILFWLYFYVLAWKLSAKRISLSN